MNNKFLSKMTELHSALSTSNPSELLRKKANIGSEIDKRVVNKRNVKCTECSRESKIYKLESRELNISHNILDPFPNRFGGFQSLISNIQRYPEEVKLDMNNNLFPSVPGLQNPNVCVDPLLKNCIQYQNSTFPKGPLSFIPKIPVLNELEENAQKTTGEYDTQGDELNVNQFLNII